MKKILLIESNNFFDKPVGGQLTFTLNMMEAFGSQLMLVGWGKDDEPVGEIIDRIYKGKKYKLLVIAKRRTKSKKPLIPNRFFTFLGVLKYKKQIIDLKINNIFTSAPEAMVLIASWKNFNICYSFSGLNNPLRYSKYKFARVLSFLFDSIFLPKLRKVKCIIAAADKESIHEFVNQTKNIFTITDINQFPTRIDTRIFRSIDNRKSLREKLNISGDAKIVVTVGRLGAGKGWRLMIDAFSYFHNIEHKSYLYFIGDGEDYDRIISYKNVIKLNNEIILVGRKKPSEVAEYLNAADLFIMGSEREGWSTTLVEALACNIPVCVTDFSSANELVQNGVNGYVVEERDAKLFSGFMFKSIQLEVNNDKKIKEYSLQNLKTSLLEYWEI